MLSSRFWAVTMTGSKMVGSSAAAACPEKMRPIGMALARSARFFLCTAKPPYVSSAAIINRFAPKADRAARGGPVLRRSRPRGLEVRRHPDAQRERRARGDVVVVV